MLILEYYTEDIELENREYYTCLPVKYGLSWKHHHYAVQITGSSILLNNGKLILNSTDKEAFSEDYDHSIANVEQCFFNTRTASSEPHIYLNCRIETAIQYKSDRGRMEVITLKPFQMFRINYNQFPITIKSQTLELNDVLDKQDNAVLDDMYAKVTREAWYSALHLPRALLERKNRIIAHEYWTDVAKLSVKYPKLRYYFTISLGVMSLTALGLITGCALKYKVNLWNCFMFMYSCCRPKGSNELNRSPILKRKKRRGSQSPETDDVEGKVRTIVRDMEDKSSKRQKRRRERSRSRSRSRSQSRGRTRSGRSGTPLPSYDEVSTALLKDNSTQVRDKTSSAYRTK